MDGRYVPDNIPLTLAAGLAYEAGSPSWYLKVPTRALSGTELVSGPFRLVSINT